MYFFVELPFHLGVKLVNNISVLIQHHQGQETFPFNTGMVSIFNIVWPQFYLLLIQLFITSAFHQSNNGLNFVRYKMELNTVIPQKHQRTTCA